MASFTTGGWPGYLMGRYEEHRANKKALSDAQFQEKHDEIQGMIENLQTKLSYVPESDRNTPDYLKLKDQYAQAIQDRDEHWKSLDHPSEILKFGKMLGRDLHFSKKESPIAPPVYGQPTMEVNGEKVPTEPAYKIQGPQTPAQLKAQKEANQLEAAAPLSPEQVATQNAEAATAGSLASVRSGQKAFIELNPSSTPEEQQANLSQLIQKHFGSTERGRWTQVSGKINDQPVTLNYDSMSNRYTYPTGETVPPEDLAPGHWVPDAKNTGTVNSLQISQYNEDVKSGKFKGSYPEWLKQQRSGTEIKYDASTDQVVDPTSGTRYSEGDPNNPPEIAKLFKSIGEMTAKKQAFQMKLAAMRGTQYNMSKPMIALDTENGNAPTAIPFGVMMKNPTRYIPAGEADKAIAKENLMQDIAGTSAQTRQAIIAMKSDFPESMKTKIVLAMRAEDPRASLDQLIASQAIGSLNSEQQDFLISTRQLVENAMAMRSLLSSGQGSEDMRNAIRDTVPGLLSPNKSYALRQLDAFDKTIARLHRGVPKVPLRSDMDTPPPPSGGSNSPANHQVGTKYKHTATGPNRHKIGTNDDPNSPTARWYDVQTGKEIK